MNDNATIAQLNQRDAARRRAYRDWLDFYRGEQWAGAERRGEKRLTFNYARVFIDKLTSYLMSGVGLTVDAAGDDGAARDAARRAEAALRRVYEENGLEQLDLETETDCAVLGDGCYKVTWDAPAKRVRVTAPDIQGVYAWWLGDDTARVWRVASRYPLSAEEADYLYGVRPPGQTATLTELWTDDGFELFLNDTLLEKKANPYGFIPFIIFPNLREPKSFWGTSDLVQIREPQRELNRAVSQLAHILELSGNPIAVLENVESADDIAVRPGAVWTIPEAAKAYLLDLLQGGGVSLHIEYINLLYRTMHDVSESPRAAFGGTERDLSGVALELEMNPLVQKVRRKRLIRAGVYAQRARMILNLLEKYGGESFGDCRPRVRWSPILPQDTARLVANEQAMVQSGLHSRRGARAGVGSKAPEAEFRRWLDERGAILRMNRDMNARTTRGEGEGVL